ncbi:MAG: SCO family protein, partial [Anaerolineales bacterium]|nr:SCO family protein [Anaerolineales bacterium]
SMTTMAEVKRLLGAQGDRLQVLFITVDPERDTQALLKGYMANFDPSFIALRPEPDELKGVASDFKIYFKKVPGSTPTSYTMDHSAGKYIFDTAGRVRLFSNYGSTPEVIAQDIKTLLKSSGN